MKSALEHREYKQFVVLYKAYSWEDKYTSFELQSLLADVCVMNEEAYPNRYTFLVEEFTKIPESLLCKEYIIVNILSNKFNNGVDQLKKNDCIKDENY